MGGLSDPKTNRKLLLTSYLLWPRYVTYRSRRWLRLKLQKYDLENRSNQTLTASTYRLPVISDPNSELETKGFLFVENFLDQDSYSQLIKAWPKKRWFEPLEFRKNGKSYDSGLRWNISKQRIDKSIEANPDIMSIYGMLRSKEFCENLTEICNDKIERESYSLLLTQSYSHSYLTPHKDSMGTDTAKNNSIVNIIYFVKANGNGWEAGGTSILGDATFSKPIFVPTNLNNTALIYRGAANLWHGFPRIARGNYRKTVLSAYWSKS
jgi:hypothetical protein